MVIPLLGGLGMFLLGMVLLTDGLKALAGDALRRILTRYIAGPVSGVAWGALVTALVQSSTATTLATVGFVSAGLLTFTQAVGVIFGTNLGTTSTGWIVSQLGFKVSLGSFSPPLVLIGVALRLLSRGRWAHAGTAVAGFGLMFIGIDMLQSGMSGLAARISPGDLPGAAGALGLGGRALLMGFGALMTIVMQSSSASMAATLAAVASGAIDIEQAAALIVGQNIGTTPKAVAAAIGAPAAAKRTAMAHVLFNLLTAGVAFAALPAMLSVVGLVAGTLGADDAPTVLALFHTLFNVLGVALLLPLVGPFSRMIERLVPESEPRSTRFLAPAVAEVGPVALEATRRAMGLVAATAARGAERLLTPGEHEAAGHHLRIASDELIELQRFLHGLAQSTQGASEVNRHAALLHAVDHTTRLIDDLRQWSAGGAVARRLDDAVIRRAADPLRRLIGPLVSAWEESSQTVAERPDSPLTRLAEEAERVSRGIAELRKAERRTALAEAARGQVEPDRALSRIETLLALDGAAYHIWRTAHHLAGLPSDEPAESPSPTEGRPAGGVEAHSLRVDNDR